MNAAATASPVSFPVHIGRLPSKGMAVEIEADDEQRAALAAAHDLRAVAAFKATLHVSGWKKGGVKVAGRVKATIVQDCVVTLEPVEQVVDEEVSSLFLPEGSKLAIPARSAEGEIVLDAEGDDSPELFSGDTIDVGKLAEEFFTLGIDPYPRKAGVSVGPEENEQEDGQEEERGPLFEQLQALKSRT